MSIWASHEPIGFDDFAEDGVTNRGQVRAFANGWSNHYPTTDDEAEMEAVVGLAHIPSWCVPGNGDDEDFERVGPWIRMDAFAEETKNFWLKDDDGNPTVVRMHSSVVLDEEAATILRDQLTAWLDLPKARPIEEQA